MGMSGSKNVLMKMARSNYQWKNPAGAMSMTTVTCMPISTPTQTLMVSLKATFAPNTMPSSMILWLTSMPSLQRTLKMKMRTKMVKMVKMVKMRGTTEKTLKTSTGTEPCNDEGANLSFVTLYNYLKQFLQV